MVEAAAAVVLDEAVSGLLNGIILALEKTWYFKSKLKEMQETLEKLKPDFQDIETLNKKLDRRKVETERFMKLLKEAEDLVKKCEKIKWDLCKRYRHASKLDETNKSLLKLVLVDLQLHIAVTVGETYEVVTRIENELVTGSSSGFSSGVPLQKRYDVGFEDRLRDLMDLVLKDDDFYVVVVSAAGGCGKSTLVTQLCHDPMIKAKFRRIYFVTVSRVYNKKVIIKKLLGERSGIIDDDDDDDAAMQQWGSFLGKVESQVLLVLDDVWSESVINDFDFRSPRYKILVTSRMTFKNFKTYKLPAFNDEDATCLFRGYAFSNQGNEHNNIPDDLVHKLVKCCKNHPLLLSVVGRSLKGTHVDEWESMSNELYEENISVLDLDESILKRLKKSLYFFEKEPQMKQCYQDLGLFPEDQKIAATALKDIWAHLYNHDDKGLATTKILTRLSSINLASLSPVRKHLPNYCEEGSVEQHDMVRALAIRLSNEKPIEHRERLIINADGQQRLESHQVVNARILSISTDERFPITSIDIQAPKVELFVLNFMSSMHPLPHFMQNMESLKILIITNYGYHFSEIQNFPEPHNLSGLTKIRLDHVSISSISTTILMLENLQKLSLIMCKIGNCFNEGIPNKLTSLLEINIESCDDLVTFPAMLCNIAGLKKLSITNCHELTLLPEDFGNSSNLEILRLASCTKLPILPESTGHLKLIKNP